MAVPQKIKPPRTYPTVNGVFALRCHINQAAPVAARGQVSIKTGVPYCIGTIPKGSFVLPAAKHVLTIFNGTTPAVDVGTLATPNGFIPTASIAPGAVAFAGGLSGTLMGLVADDTPVYVTLTAAGNSAGELDLVLPFYSAQD